MLHRNKKSHSILCRLSVLLSLMVCSNTHAEALGNQGWYVNLGMGYAKINQIQPSDSETIVGKLGLGKTLFHFSHGISTGAELGVQNGNTMRMGVSDDQLNELGGLPIQTTLKPILDLLGTLKIKTGKFLFIDTRVGAAYRSWQINDRETVNNVSDIRPELEIGLGSKINPHFDLSLLYQTIFSTPYSFTVDPVAETAHVNSTPQQSGVLLVASINI